MILTSPFADAKGGGSHADRVNHRKRGTCESVECAQFHFLENANCVNQCISRSCYDEVYKGKELEDGEINALQERQFKTCIRTETLRNRNLK
jgi:hypothetical protein